MEKRKLDLRWVENIGRDHALFGKYCNDTFELFILQEIADHDGQMTLNVLKASINQFIADNRVHFSRITQEYTDDRLMTILRSSMKIKFENGATPFESLVKFSEDYRTSNPFERATLPSESSLNNHTAQIAKSLLPCLPSRKFLFNRDISMPQAVGQWNKQPMGKKKGGMCQTNPDKAQQLIEVFGSFLGFLIKVFPLENRSPDFDIRQFEEQILNDIVNKIHDMLISRRNEVSMIEIIYKLYNSGLMVDEQIVFASLHKYRPGKYDFENGFLFDKAMSVRGSDSLQKMLLEHSDKSNKQASIQVKEHVAGDAEIAHQLTNDAKYLIKQKPILPPDAMKGEKLEGPSDVPMLEEEEVQEVQEEGGFFIPGFDDEDGDEERNREEKEKRFLRNRSLNFLFQDIQDEFIDKVNDNGGWDQAEGYFIDSLMQNVKETNTEIFENYKDKLDQTFVSFFKSKLQEAVKQDGKSFPMELAYFRKHLSSSFPISGSQVTNAESNEWFMSAKQLLEYLGKTIESDKSLLIELDWKNPILESVLILNLDPRRKKMLAQSSKGKTATVMLPNLDYLTESSPQKTSSPRGLSKIKNRSELSKQKQWDEVAKTICLHIDKTFQNRKTTLHTGIASNVGDQVLLDMILPAVFKRHFDLIKEEIESVYWKILLRIGDSASSLLHKGHLLCFSMNASEQSTSGLDYVQLTNDSYPEYSEEISQWRSSCYLPNMTVLFTTIAHKLKDYFNRKKINTCPFEEIKASFIRDPELQSNFKYQNKQFQTVELPLQAKSAIIERLLFIGAIQDKDNYIFDGDLSGEISRVRNNKRKASEIAPTGNDVQQAAATLSRLDSVTNSIEIPEAAKKLLAGIVFDKTKTIKKDEIDSRPTNIKVITSYFKDKFRNELASKGLRRQIGWSLIAEIIVSKSTRTSFLTMGQLARIYKNAIKEIIDKTYYKKAPHWDLCALNDEIHQLSPVFPVRYETVQGITKSVIVEIEEQKFCQLMAEFQNMCNSK